VEALWCSSTYKPNIKKSWEKKRHKQKKNFEKENFVPKKLFFFVFGVFLKNKNILLAFIVTKQKKNLNFLSFSLKPILFLKTVFLFVVLNKKIQVDILNALHQQGVKIYIVKLVYINAKIFPVEIRATVDFYKKGLKKKLKKKKNTNLQGFFLLGIVLALSNTSQSKTNDKIEMVLGVCIFFQK